MPEEFDNPSLKVTKYNEDGKLFLKAFLIDSSENENDWKVINSSIPRNIKSFIGMPLVLDQNFDHPKWVEGGLESNILSQQRYAIGIIRDVVESAGKWDAIIEITDPLAKESIENNDIPFYVSPRIVHDPEEKDDAITDWMGIHLAVVDKPAYGDKAKFKGACYGMAEQCQAVLKQAKKEPCGFCVKKALLKLVTNHNSSHSSLNLVRKKSASMEDDKERKPSDSEEAPMKEECVSKDDLEALKAQLAAQTAAFEEARKVYDSKIASMDEENKTAKIASVLSAKIADKDELAKKVKYFVDAKVAPEVVAEAFKMVPDIHTQTQGTQNNTFTAKHADASSANKGSYSAFQRYTASVINGGSL